MDKIPISLIFISFFKFYICYGLKASIDNHQSNPASSMQKTISHCTCDLQILKVEKNKIEVPIRVALNCFVNMSFKLTQITCKYQYIIEI